MVFKSLWPGQKINLFVKSIRVIRGLREWQGRGARQERDFQAPRWDFGLDHTSNIKTRKQTCSLWIREALCITYYMSRGHLHRCFRGTIARNDPTELDFRNKNLIISKNVWYKSFNSSVNLSVLQGDRGLQGERGFKGMKGDMGDPGTPGLAVSSFSHYKPSFV